jgi:hypothetical protein
LNSCGETDIKDKETITVNNKSTTISTDTSELGKLINLKRFKPTHVKFKFVHYDNSAKNQRLSISGPSDSYLEAVLYFDPITFHKIQQDNLLLSTVSSNRKTEYQFVWLDNDIKRELVKTDGLITDWPPHFFVASPLNHGGFFTLHNKLLLRLYSQL